MKYLLYPFYAILIILLTLFEIIANSLIWTSLLIWHLKLPKEGWDWKQLHIYDNEVVSTGDGLLRIRHGWDNTICETLYRRLTFGDYKHTD